MYEWIINIVINTRIELIRDDYFFYIIYDLLKRVYNLKCKYSIDKNINININILRINSNVL